MSYRILVVDDSPVARKVVRRALGMTQLDIAEIFEAGSGVEALASLRSNWVDLVLCDVHMPEMNGQELVEHMKQQDDLRGTPVIIISSDTTDARRDSLLAAGADDYLHKPITPERLRAAVLCLLHPENLS
jgi:two-component system chemotaxis response regulator CheY